VAGFLYSPGDVGELGGFVDRLVDDALLRRRVSRAARLSVADRSWRAVNDALVEHYREVSGVPARAGLLAG